MKAPWIVAASALAFSACGGSTEAPGGGSTGIGGSGTGGSAGSSGGAGATGGTGGACVQEPGACDTSSACCTGYCTGHKCSACIREGEPCGKYPSFCCSGICPEGNRCGCVPSGSAALGGPTGEEWKVCCSRKMDDKYICL